MDSLIKGGSETLSGNGSPRSLKSSVKRNHCAFLMLIIAQKMDNDESDFQSNINI